MIHWSRPSFLSLLALALLAWPPSGTTHPIQRWLADPQLLTTNAQGQQYPNTILALAVVNPTTGWAITSQDILRFDGRYLHNDQQRNAPGFPLAISMTGPQSGWVVGTTNLDMYRRELPSTNVSMLRYAGNNTWQEGSAVVHKDGTVGSLAGALTGVVALADGEAWSVGAWHEDQAEHPLLLHFDGSSWHDSTPDGWTNGRLTTVTMVGPEEGWAGGVLGRWQGTDSRGRRPLLAHWQNGHWIQEPLPPSVDDPTVTIDQLSMVDATQGWAVYHKDQSTCAQTGLLHYQDGIWSELGAISNGQEYIAGFGLVPGTSHGWISLRPACVGITPGRRMHFDDGLLTPDTTGATLVPTVYALLNDDLQWAAQEGSLLRWSDETLPTTRQPEGRPGGRYFAATGHDVDGLFLDYYSSHGLDLGDPGVSERESLALFGYPISEPFQEISPETGALLLVQYFERARFEYHPENTGPYNVLLGRLSYRLSNGHTGGQTGCEMFKETGFALCPPFRTFWHQNNGLPVFGLPVADAEQETSLTDGKTYVAQRFERERLEQHPEQRGTPYEIQLGLLGAEELRARGYLVGN